MEHFDIQNLTFSHAAAKGKLSLDGVSLRIRAGEFLVLCGRSGSGKTTLLRHLKTVLTPNGKRSGEILFCGTPLAQVSERDQAAKIGFVMQNPDDQIVTDKVWHELAFGLESLGCDQAAMRTRVAEMACYFGIQDWFHRDVATLSGGQKQLLNLASIMAMQPEVLILDEPTSQLDPIAASDFLNTVRKINTELGTTVIITEHRLEDIFPYADRAVVMDSGKIIADDAPANVGQLLFEQKNPMFAAMPTPVRVFYGAGCTGESPLTVRQGRNWLSGEFPAAPKLKAEPASAPAEVENPALSLKELWFRYEKDGRDILRGVSAEIPAGEISAILGGNGAGKSTTLKAICGICRPYRGKIKLFGKPMEKYSTKELFRGCIAMLPQDPKSLFVKKTVREDLAEMTADAEKIARTAEICQITPLLESHPYDLSGGEQQRAALAKAARRADKGHRQLLQGDVRRDPRRSETARHHNRHGVARRGVLRPVRRPRVHVLRWADPHDRHAAPVLRQQQLLYDRGAPHEPPCVRHGRHSGGRHRPLPAEQGGLSYEKVPYRDACGFSPCYSADTVPLYASPRPGLLYHKHPRHCGADRAVSAGV